MKNRKPIIFTSCYDTATTRGSGANSAKDLSKIHRGIPIAAMASLGSDHCVITSFHEWSVKNEGGMYVGLYSPHPFEVYESGRKVNFQDGELPNDDRVLMKVEFVDEIKVLLPRKMTKGDCPKEVIDLICKGLKNGSIQLVLDGEFDI